MHIKKGFTLLEMVVVIALIGITMTFIVPSFKKKSSALLPDFIGNLNLFLRKASINGLERNSYQKIYINIKNGSIELQEESGKNKTTGEKLFTTVLSPRYQSTLPIPEKIEFRHFYITTAQGKKDQLAKASDDVWFFITPDGTAQDVTITLIETTEKSTNTQAELTLNPLTLFFEEVNASKTA